MAEDNEILREKLIAEVRNLLASARRFYELGTPKEDARKELMASMRASYPFADSNEIRKVVDDVIEKVYYTRSLPPGERRFLTTPDITDAKNAYMRGDVKEAGKLLLKKGYNQPQIEELFSQWARERDRKEEKKFPIVPVAAAGAVAAIAAARGGGRKHEPVRIEITIRSMPNRGIPVRIHFVEASMQIKQLEDRIKTLEDEIKYWEREYTAETNGTERRRIIRDEIRPRENDISNLRKQIDDIKEHASGEVGRTDFTLGLQTLGPVEIEIPSEDRGIKFDHWETFWGTWGGVQPNPFHEARDEIILQRLEFFERILGNTRRIGVRLIRPKEVAEPPIYPASREFDLPVERREDHFVAKFEMTAFYQGGEVTHKMRPTSAGGYRGGTFAGGAGTARLGRAIGTVTNAQWSRETELKYKPALTAAANNGRKLLHDYGEAEYERLFMHPSRGLIARFQAKANNLRNLEREARRARRTLRRIVGHGGIGFLGRGILGAGSEKLVGAAETALEGGRQLSAEDRAALQNARDTMKKYFELRDEYEREFEAELQTASSTLRKYLEDRADTLAITLARRYKIPLGGRLTEGAEPATTQQQLQAELRIYAQELAEELITRGNTRLQAFFRGLKIISREGRTVREVWMNLLSNLWGLVTGPWLLGFAVLMFEYFVIILPFSGEAPMLTTMLIIGAIGVFLLNFEEVKFPLDWLTHLIAGAMIGGGTGLFLLALVKPFAPSWPGDMPGIPIFGGGGFFSGGFFIFWMIWFAIALFIGAFQFYHPPGKEGYDVVFKMTILTIVFAYFALGPYNGYYKATMAPVGSVVKSGFFAVRDAFLDVWLLGTNPTEWYARQQLKNVRAEKPLDFPKGIEIEDLVAIPDSVPASEPGLQSEFAVVAVISNRGDLPAKNIAVEIECNDYAFAVNDGDKCKTGWNVSKFERTLEPGEGTRIQFTNLFAYAPKPGRSAEFQLAKVTVRISYEYETSSSLNVEVMTQEEVSRRQFAQQSVYRTVTATSKATPAELSLNVGPQPLTAGAENNRLLIAVLNARQDGTVLLAPNTPIKITVPQTIISALSCRGCESTKSLDGKLTTTCFVPKEREIKYSEFKSIFAFSCNIDTQGPDKISIARTDLITAEMPRSIFKVKRSKDIAILPPLKLPEAKEVKGLSSSAKDCQGEISQYTNDYNLYRETIDKAVADNAIGDFGDGHAIVAAIITQESGWKQGTTCSEKGGCGIMQIIKTSAENCEDLGGWEGIKNNANNNILCGTRILKGKFDSVKDLNKYGNENDNLLKLAIAAYNGGQGTIAKAIEIAGDSKWESIGNIDIMTQATSAFPEYFPNPREKAEIILRYVDTVYGTNYPAWQSCIKFAKVEYAWPVDGYKQISLCFKGIDPPRYTASDPHKGIDITGTDSADINDKPVEAVADGTVDDVKEGCSTGPNECNGGRGNYVVIAHRDGRKSLYYHLNDVVVQTGTPVEKGKTVIGTVGSTGRSDGPHLHLQICEKEPCDKLENLLNPCNYLDCSGTKCTGVGSTLKGGSEYCKGRAGTGSKCLRGEGGCASDDECNSNQRGPDGTGLKCTDVGLNVKICCYEEDQKDNFVSCRNAFEQWQRS